MTDYDIKRGHWKNIDGPKLKKLLEDIFGEAKKDGDKLLVHYKALDPLIVQMMDKKTLHVETKMDPSVNDDDAADTVARYNDFLKKATGFTSKQRRDRLKKKAKKGEL